MAIIALAKVTLRVGKETSSGPLRLPLPQERKGHQSDLSQVAGTVTVWKVRAAKPLSQPLVLKPPVAGMDQLC